MTSDDELKDYEINDGSKSNMKNNKGDVSRRRYVYESRESVPVQIIRNKTLGSRLVEWVNKSGINSNSNRNPER